MGRSWTLAVIDYDEKFLAIIPDLFHERLKIAAPSCFGEIGDKFFRIQRIFSFRWRYYTQKVVVRYIERYDFAIVFDIDFHIPSLDGNGNDAI